MALGMLLPTVANGVRALAWPLLALRRALVAPRGAWITVTLSGPVSEIERPFSALQHPRDLILRGAPKPRTTLAALRALAALLADDPRVGGVLVQIEPLECGWAVAQGLRAWIASLRAAGRTVVAYLPQGSSQREYFVASAATRVVAAPLSSVSPLGLAAGITFVRGLLARGGIDAEVFARREFKSAAEALTRDGYSEANRMQTEALLDRLQTLLLEALTEGRAMSPERARALLDAGPFSADDAVREGLLDAVAYEDELPLHLDGPDTRRVSASAYLRAMRALRFRPMVPAKRVGVVELRGAIVSQARGGFGEAADARKVVAALRAARANPRIGAVVLHIDSPGGSALASDQIAREVQRLRERKPVVAYFADVAASGGYYAAAPAQEIVARPATLTGSIGVIAVRFQATRALEKLDLRREVIRRGERADLMSPYRPLNEGDRAAIEREIDGVYDRFVDIVARGRGRDAHDIEPLARGRVYAGADAHAVGLVDHLGGFELAMERAQSLAGGRFHDEPVVIAPPRHTPDPPEAPGSSAALSSMMQHLAAQLGARGRALDLLTVGLHCPHERLFALADTLPDLG